MTSEIEDIVLIRRYATDNDQAAFEILLNRYIDKTRIIVKKYCENKSDVDDLVQQIWIKIIQSIKGYEEREKFIGFHNVIAKNTIRDYWKHNNVRSSTSSLDEMEEGQHFNYEQSAEISEERKYSNREAMEYLMTKSIPSLPWDLRTVFILRHESEYWEDKKRLSWKELSVLTGLTEDEAWSCFENARTELVDNYRSEGLHKNGEISHEAFSVFIIWTQAQRLSESKKVTENEIAKLLGIPLNTFKTKYRKAKELLTESMQEWDVDFAEIG